MQFGQSVLLKRTDKVEVISEKLLPIKQQDIEPLIEENLGIKQFQKLKKRTKGGGGFQTATQPTLWKDDYNKETIQTTELTVEKAADLVVKYRFKTDVIGSMLLKLAEQEHSEEKTMLFAKLIARAINARIKR